MIWIYWLIGLTISVLISIWVIKRDRLLGYTFLTTVAAAFVVIANVLTPRLMSLDIFGYSTVLVTGGLIWPFTGQISDMINEVYGKKKTLYAFAFAYVANFLYVIFIRMASDTTPTWSNQEEVFWLSYFTPSLRVFIASSISFVICQYVDATVFSMIKERFRERETNVRVRRIAILGSVRSILSDIVNMFFDAVLFSVITFAGLIPMSELGNLIISSVLIKCLLSLIDTPLFTLFRVAIKDIERAR